MSNFSLYVAGMEVKKKADKYEAMRQAREQQSFATVEELNQRVQSFIAKRGVNFTDKELLVIDLIARHAVTVPGICWASVEYITREAGVSAATYSRAIRKAEELGFMQRSERKRVNGRRGSNLIIIHPELLVGPGDEPEDSAEESAHDGAAKAAKAAPNKAETVEIAAGIINKHYKALKEKDIKRDEYNAPTRDPIFLKYVLNEIKNHSEKVYIPEPIVQKIVETLTRRYAGASFAAVNRNDLIASVWKALDTFMEWYRKGHNIAVPGAFFATLFEQILLQKKTIRDIAGGLVPATHETMCYVEAADRRDWFRAYVLGQSA